MYFIVPAHLQGENKGLSLALDSSRQILQVGRVVVTDTPPNDLLCSAFACTPVMFLPKSIPLSS